MGVSISQGFFSDDDDNDTTNAAHGETNRFATKLRPPRRANRFTVKRNQPGVYAQGAHAVIGVRVFMTHAILTLTGDGQRGRGST